MEYVGLHFYYLRYIIQKKVFTLFYKRIDDQIDDIFMNLLSKVKFVKFHTLLRLQEAINKGVCEDLIPTSESLEWYVDVWVLEPRSLLFHHIPISFGDSKSSSQLAVKLIISSTD